MIVEQKMDCFQTIQTVLGEYSYSSDQYGFTMENSKRDILDRLNNLAVENDTLKEKVRELENQIVQQQEIISQSNGPDLVFDTHYSKLCQFDESRLQTESYENKDITVSFEHNSLNVETNKEVSDISDSDKSHDTVGKNNDAIQEENDDKLDSRMTKLVELLTNDNTSSSECDANVTKIDEDGENYMVNHKKQQSKVRIAEGKKWHHCFSCDKQFSSKSKLNNHINALHFGRITCSICGATFATRGGLKTHLMIHNGQKPHTCSTCGKSFRQSSTLKEHMTSHTGIKPFACTICGKQFLRRGKLEDHQAKHTGEKAHRCEVCDKSYLQADGLKRHILRDHEGVKLGTCCEVCGKQVVRITAHMMTHTGEKPHACQDCGKRFAIKRNLEDHILVHTGERPHACEKCGKKFKTPSALTVHLRRHDGVKPFACSHCDKRFTASSQLQYHERGHTGEKPFSCDVCGKKFRQKSVLMNHILVHTGERPHRCLICGKTFAQSAHRNTHVKLVHKQHAETHITV